jgi:hypothetical protein
VKITALAPLVCPFTVAVDRREQLPFAFLGLRADARDSNRPLCVPTAWATLDTGDYSIVGHLDKIAVERKSKEDLFLCCGAARGRFQRCLARLAALPAPALVVVESDWGAIVNNPPPFTRLAPKVVVRSVLAWTFRFPTVHWMMAADRRMAEVLCFRFLERYWRNLPT